MTEERTYPKYSSRLKTWRRQKGFTQSELAEEIGVTARTVQNWENHSRIPPLKTRKRFQALIDRIEPVRFPVITLFYNEDEDDT